MTSPQWSDRHQWDLQSQHRSAPPTPTWSPRPASTRPTISAQWRRSPWTTRDRRQHREQSCRQGRGSEGWWRGRWRCSGGSRSRRPRRWTRLRRRGGGSRRWGRKVEEPLFNHFCFSSWMMPLAGGFLRLFSWNDSHFRYCADVTAFYIRLLLSKPLKTQRCKLLHFGKDIEYIWYIN